MDRNEGYTKLLKVLDNRSQKVTNFINGIGTSMVGFVNSDKTLTLHWAGADSRLNPANYYVCENLLENECIAPSEIEIKTKKRYLSEGAYLVIAVDNKMICVVDRLVKATDTD